MNYITIDRDSKERVRQVMQYAEAHPYTEVMMKEIIDEKAPAPGDIDELVVEFEGGVRAVYTIDSYDGGLLAKHLSVSVNMQKYPHPKIVDLVLKEFGMNPLDADEETGDFDEEATKTLALYKSEEVHAINIVQNY